MSVRASEKTLEKRFRQLVHVTEAAANLSGYSGVSRLMMIHGKSGRVLRVE